MNGSIAFPYKDLTIYDAINSFNYLKSYKTKGLQSGKVFTKFNYEFKIEDKFIDEPLIGNISSDYFQQYNRMKCAHAHFPSPVEVWCDDKYLHHVTGGIFTLKYECLNMSKLRSLIALRCYIASQFRPAVAKSIYEVFNSVDVLDFSAGWGDRLAGFYASDCGHSYIGIDPNIDVYNTYYKQVNLYKHLTDEKLVKFINKPAEDVKLESNIVDTVFTSPPYFNTEKYSTDNTQSCVRYNTDDKWLKGFMYPTLNMCWDALKTNGHLIINISDVKTNGKIHKISDAINYYIQDVLGGKYEMGFGMKMSARPNCYASNASIDEILCEPVWVWKK